MKNILKILRWQFLKIMERLQLLQIFGKLINKEELSIDLMRYNEKALIFSMEFLFINIMLWGKEEGYKRFNLGMAPLSGLEYRGTTSLWNKLGSFVFKKWRKLL